MSEAELQAKCIKEAKKQLRGVVIARSSTEGFPDRMFIWHGRLIFVEFKATGKVARPLQVEMHRLIAKQHIETFVIDNYKDFIQVIDRMKGITVMVEFYDRCISPKSAKLAGETIDI